MDTKWKKSKKITGVITFVLGFTLLAGSLMYIPAAGYGLSPGAYGGRRYSIAELTGEWQETEDYREEISAMLNNLIRLGAGQPVSWQTVQTVYAGNIYTYNGSQRGRSLWGGQTTVDEVVVEQAVEGGKVQSAKGGSETAQTTAQTADFSVDNETLTPEEIAGMREAFLEAHKPDRNILFEVKKDGKTLYHNLEGEQIGGEENLLPEGYNVLLKFDGKQTSILLNGKNVDIYGAKEGEAGSNGGGVYEEDGKHWRVPGYSNYQLPPDWDSCEVIMAVRETPLLYHIGESRYGGGLYYSRQDFISRENGFMVWLTVLLSAIVLLLFSGLFRKQRREAEKELGIFLGRFALEIRLAVILVIASLAAIEFLNSYITAKDAVWVILTLWTLRLIFLDLRFGGNPWKNSVTLRFLKFQRTKELALPVQKRIVSRALLPAGLLLLSAIPGVLTVLAGFRDGLNNRRILLFMLLTAVFFIAGLAALIQNTWRLKLLAQDLGYLNDQIDAAFSGKERKAYRLPADSDLAEMARKVGDMYNGLENAIEERMKSERMKVELVANVSHDIKTPLTSIISYVDILKEDEGLPDDLKDYVAILSQKSERLKTMVQDIFEISKAASGQLSVNCERLDLCKLLRQTLADMQEQIEKAPVTVRTQLPDIEIFIMADGQRMYRVFQNLIQNALQYSLEGSRIFITLEKAEDVAVTSVRNTSKYELEGGRDFTERFVRGDASRSDGGSGLGLSIAKSFTEACGGSMQVETLSDLFAVNIKFRLADSR